MKTLVKESGMKTESAAQQDYQRVAAAIDFLVAQGRQQPSLEAVAAAVNLSPFHFQRLFTRWTGVSPKRFLQALTLERAKQSLRANASTLEAAHVAGLSGGSRLYDHFVQLEAVTPSEFQRQGEGLCIEYACVDSPFGKVFAALTQRGICRLHFVDDADEEQRLRDALVSEWPRARLVENREAVASLVAIIFKHPGPVQQPLSVLVSGTNFQVNVWRALLAIEVGQLYSYSDIATAIGKPKAVRAVGSAIGANPVAFLIPCHRVIQQSGGMGGYRWGLTRKRALQAWEYAANT